MHASCRPEVKANLVIQQRDRPRAGREDSQEELVCVDLARSRPSTAQGKLVKACQVPDENPGADEGLNLLGVTLVLPTSGLAGADGRCQMLARSVGVGNRTWRAYLSATASGGQAAVNARDQIGSGPWYNPRGVR